MFGIYKILIAAYNHTCKRKTFAISDTLTFLSTLHSSIFTLLKGVFYNEAFTEAA